MSRISSVTSAMEVYYKLTQSQLSEEDIKEYCKGKVAHYKVPRYIRFGNDFPMTVTGKVQKYKMREISIKELGLEEQETA